MKMKINEVPSKDCRLAEIPFSRRALHPPPWATDHLAYSDNIKGNTKRYHTKGYTKRYHTKGNTKRYHQKVSPKGNTKR